MDYFPLMLSPHLNLSSWPKSSYHIGPKPTILVLGDSLDRNLVASLHELAHIGCVQRAAFSEGDVSL